jgi:hypothetical protein
MSRKFALTILLPVLLLAALSAACSSTSAATPSIGTGRAFSGGAGGASGAGGTNPLPPASAYLVGTFKLEGTGNAVDEKTAAALLPLYQMLKELSSNNSTAQAEIDSVADQIKSTMTPAQVQAISAMNLTQQDLFSLIQQLGSGNRTGGTARTPGAGGFNGGGGPPDGGFGPGGFGPGGGGGAAGGGTTNMNQSATLQAVRTQQAKAARLPNSALLDAMIQLLQQRAGVATNTPEGSPAGGTETPAATSTPTP